MLCFVVNVTLIQNDKYVREKNNKTNHIDVAI